ncbi:MAG: hypothetical protein ACT4QB_16725, partial [Gammaproteobacteria bacterium]
KEYRNKPGRAALAVPCRTRVSSGALGNEAELLGVATWLDGEVRVKVRPIQVLPSRTLDVEQRGRLG